ncbi:MAG: sigma-70 family RNA polymerase sigma factor [Solirubrobacterales bacterium]|nr:sigma-70 family RNA polymerase sigma factor [Solirubrobacterales bacterium]MBV9715074.1 sigma-70 family RNA polymerase sigma factor [Solirubrobacterales bacterium]
MEVSALRYTGGMGLHGRSPLLRLQSDERLITLVRRGNSAAFEVLVARYQSRLLAFCRHLLGSREDAEDVLQEALAAAFNAILADERPINVRPWLYRIARNRCLNHLRRIQAVGVDSMDVHLSEHGTSTADKVHRLEEFWMLVGDIQGLPETQKTALVLREMDALSYEQIADAMETTVPSVKSLLVRARVSLAEAAEARMLTCDEVRVEMAEAAEGLRKRTSPVVRRHLRACERCSVFQGQLKETTKALSAVLPVGPLVLLKKLALVHLGHSAGASAASGSGAGAAGQAAAVGSTAAAGSALVGSGAGSALSFSVGTIATKAAAGLAAAALVTAGAVEVSHTSRRHSRPTAAAVPSPSPAATAAAPTGGVTLYHSMRYEEASPVAPAAHPTAPHPEAAKAPAPEPAADTKTTLTTTSTATAPVKPITDRHGKSADAKSVKPTTPAGRTQSQTTTTVLDFAPTTTSAALTTPRPAGYNQSAGTPTATTATTAPTTSTPTWPTATGTSAGTDPTGTSTDPSVSTAPTGAPSSTVATDGSESNTVPVPASPSGGASPAAPDGSTTTPAG